MAVRKVSVRSCDKCGNEPAEQVTINTPETGRRYVDLCEKHRAVLVDLAAGAAADGRRKRSYTREQVADMAKRKSQSNSH
jgi:hypothetical protein